MGKEKRMVGILFSKILSLFIIMFCGYLLVKCRVLKSSDSRILSLLCVYLFLPCNILSAFQVNFTEEIRNGLILSFLTAIIIHILLLAMSPLFKKVLHLTPVEKVSVLYSNAGNLVIPLVTTLLGNEWVIYCSTFMSVQLFLLWSHGKSVLSNEKSIDIKKVLSNINMIAIFIGLVMMITGIRFPSVLEDSISSLKAIVGPSAMLISGMLIGGMDVKKALKNRRLWLTVSLRLIIIPLLFLLLIKGILPLITVSDKETILMISYIALITPSASTIVNMAQIYGKEEEYAGMINAVSTLFCLVSMPVLLVLFEIM